MQFDLFDSDLFRPKPDVSDEIPDSQTTNHSEVPPDHRPPSPFKFELFNVLTDAGSIDALHSRSSTSPETRDDLKPLRASPEPYAAFTEEDRTRYALAIWHARYNCNWVAPIFPRTYVDAPSIILKDVCEKAVDADSMTFSMFEQYLLHPKTYPAAYNYKVRGLLLRVACSLIYR